MNLLIIYGVIIALLGVGLLGWFYSPRTRRLVIFTLVVVLGFGLIFGAIALVRRFWLPLPPF